MVVQWKKIPDFRSCYFKNTASLSPQPAARNNHKPWTVNIRLQQVLFGCCSALMSEGSLNIYSSKCDNMNLKLDPTLMGSQCEDLKEKFGFFCTLRPIILLITIMMQWFIAILWWTAQSRELELIADDTASWRQRRERDTHSICQKNTVNTHFKGQETH